MKIPGQDSFTKSSISRTQTKGSKKADSKGNKVSKSEKPSTQDASSEKVALSSKAKDIVKINEIIKASSDIRTEKVERIKNDIAKGTYSVAGEKIAEKILKEILSESDFLK